MSAVEDENEDDLELDDELVLEWSVLMLLLLLLLILLLNFDWFRVSIYNKIVNNKTKKNKMILKYKFTQYWIFFSFVFGCHCAILFRKSMT